MSRRVMALAVLMMAGCGADMHAMPDSGDALNLFRVESVDLTSSSYDMTAAADIATPADMSTAPPDIATPCGGPGQACCAPNLFCDQARANTFGWFGSVCVSGSCVSCGRNDGVGFLCCDGPNKCIPGQYCSATADGIRCLG